MASDKACFVSAKTDNIERVFPVTGKLFLTLSVITQYSNVNKLTIIP
jgi:hypothetical protein